MEAFLRRSDRVISCQGRVGIKDPFSIFQAVDPGTAWSAYFIVVALDADGLNLVRESRLYFSYWPHIIPSSACTCACPTMADLRLTLWLPDRVTSRTLIRITHC